MDISSDIKTSLDMFKHKFTHLPSSRIHGVRFLAAVYAMIRPTVVEPVKQIKSRGKLLTATAISTPPSMHT